MINLKQMSIRRKWRTLVASCCNLPIKHLDPRSSHLKNVRIIIFWHIAVEYNQFMELWMRSDLHKYIYLTVIHLDFDICCVGLLLHRQLRPRPLPRHPLSPLCWGCPPICGENNITCIKKSTFWMLKTLTWKENATFTTRRGWPGVRVA